MAILAKLGASIRVEARSKKSLAFSEKGAIAGRITVPARGFPMSKIDGHGPAHAEFCQCPACQSPFTSRRQPVSVFVSTPGVPDIPRGDRFEPLPPIDGRALTCGKIAPYRAPVAILKTNVDVLTALIALAEEIVAREHAAFDKMVDLCALEPDLKAAQSRPVRHVADAETILFLALSQIAGGHISTVDVYRYRLIATDVLPIVRDHLYAAALAEASESEPQLKAARAWGKL
jgi:hypothetical protein